ncbi:Uncharacterised protein [Pseudomonas fluorescens]|nr:Uncharacterised protein [Pseudomonas fluorescens]
MSEDVDVSWIRKSFQLDFVGPLRRGIDVPKLKVPLSKVLKAVPMSPLGTTLMSMKLNRKEWVVLASSEQLAEVSKKWRFLVDSIGTMGNLAKTLGMYPDLAESFKSFEDFKASIHFKMLTSNLSTQEIFDVHEASDRFDIRLLFGDVDNSPVSPKLKSELRRLVKQRNQYGLSREDVAFLLWIWFWLGATSLFNTALSLDQGIGMVCRWIPPQINGAGVYTELCRMQKGVETNDGGIWIVDRDNVHLRSGPSKETSSIKKLRFKDSFTLLESSENGWVKVAIEIDGDRITGWIYKPFTSLIKAPVK